MDVFNILEGFSNFVQESPDQQAERIIFENRTLEPVSANLSREVYSQGHPALLEMADGSSLQVNPGERIIWEHLECGCCTIPIRIEKPQLH